MYKQVQLPCGACFLPKLNDELRTRHLCHDHMNLEEPICARVRSLRAYMVRLPHPVDIFVKRVTLLRRLRGI